MAWWVLIGHAIQISGTQQLLPYRLVTLLLHNEAAVQIFMIISGFVITHLLVSKVEPYRDYATRRFFRLFPLYVLMILIAVFSRELYAEAFGRNPWFTDPQMRLDRLAAENSDWPVHAALHLTMLHGVLPDTLLPFASSTFLAPAWSISLEWQFYLIAPLLVAAMSARRNRWLVILLLVGSIPVLAGTAGAWRYQSFVMLALPFFLGGILSRLALDGRPHWFAIGATLAASAIYLYFADPGTYLWTALVVLIWSVSLAAAVLENRKIASGLLRAMLSLLFTNRIATAFGRVSYSTYLCHIPVFGIVIGGGMMLFGEAHATVIALTLAAIALTIPASFALHRFVEMPGQQLRRAFLKGGQAAGEATKPRQLTDLP